MNEQKAVLGESLGRVSKDATDATIGIYAAPNHFVRINGGYFETIRCAQATNSVSHREPKNRDDICVEQPLQQQQQQQTIEVLPCTERTPQMQRVARAKEEPTSLFPEDMCKFV